MPKDTNGINSNFTGYIEKEDNNHHFYINGDRMTLEQYRYLKQYAKANGVSPEQAITDLAKRIEEARASNATTPAQKPKFYNEAKEEITIDQHKALGALGVLKKDEYFDQDGQKQTRNKSTNSTTNLKGDDYITPQETETKPPEIAQPWLNKQATPQQVQAAKDSLSGNGIDTIAAAEDKFEIDGESTLHSAAANADRLGGEDGSTLHSNKLAPNNHTPDEKAAAAARTLAAIASGKVGTPKTNPDAFAQDTLSGGDNTDTLEDAKGQDTVDGNDPAAQELPEISDELSAELIEEYDDQLAKDKGESNPDASSRTKPDIHKPNGLFNPKGNETLNGEADYNSADSLGGDEKQDIADENNAAVKELPEISDKLAAELAQEYDDQLAKDKGETTPDVFALGTEGTLEDADGVDTLEGTAGNDTIDASTPNDQDDISDVEATPLNLGDYEVQGADNNASDAPEETAATAVRTPSDGISRIQKAADDLERENESKNAVQSLQDYIDALEAKNANVPYNVLAQPQLRNASEDKMLANAHGYDSNKDKNFYDESMRTSNAAQTAPNALGVGSVGLKSPIQNLKELITKVHWKGAGLFGLGAGFAGHAIALGGAKLLCATALSSAGFAGFAPFVLTAAGVSYGYNLSRDVWANRDKEKSWIKNIFAAPAKGLREGGVLRDGTAHKKAAWAGLIGGGASLLVPGGSLLLGSFFSDACASGAELAPALIADPTPEVTIDPEPETETPIEPEFTILNSDDIINVGELLDKDVMGANDPDFVQKLLEHGATYNVDPAIMAPLQAALESGFNFINSPDSAEAAKVFNFMLENALSEASEGGASVTSGEYGAILTGFIEKLGDAQFKMSGDGVLPASVREAVANKTAALFTSPALTA